MRRTEVKLNGYPFVNRVKKRGDSLCVFIPHNIIKIMGIEEGDVVLVTITILEKNKNEMFI